MCIVCERGQTSVVDEGAVFVQNELPTQLDVPTSANSVRERREEGREGGREGGRERGKK